MMDGQRNRILWFGGRLGRLGDDEFRNRELELVCKRLDDVTDDDLVGVRGIVYSLDQVERTMVRRHLEANVELANNHGVATLLLAPSDHDSVHLQESLADKGLSRITYVRTGDNENSPDHLIAQMLSRHKARNGWSRHLEIEKPAELELSPIDELLLRRAFSDAKKIRLEPLSGGKTAEVFRVHAQFAQASLSVQPLPFFAKLGDRSKIDDEIKNYTIYADHYLPFHLRPNIDDNRAVQGAKRGCLVGNFVEFAKPLWVAVEDGEFSAPLNALFDMTLRGWWAQAFTDAKGSMPVGSVAAALGEHTFKHKKVREANLTRAQDLGLSRLPIEILETLCDRDKECFYRGPIHADLHPENIFVRNSDAILIDLGSARTGPIGADPACLEVALAMEVRVSDLQIDESEWKGDVDRLFAQDGFGRAPLPIEAETAWKHRVNAIRKVRTLAVAAQSCETGYQSAVAMYLLRRSMYDPGPFSGHAEGVRKQLQEIDAYRRAYALVLADRLVGENLRMSNAGTGAEDPLSRHSREPLRGEFVAGAAGG